MTDLPVEREPDKNATGLVQVIEAGETVVPSEEDETVDLTETEREPIYGVEGREGIGSGPRRLVAFVELPDRRELDWGARNMLRESDIREAMAVGARKLWTAFQQRDYGNIGFVFDPDAIEYDITRLKAGMGTTGPLIGPQSLARTLVATVVIRRGS